MAYQMDNIPLKYLPVVSVDLVDFLTRVHSTFVCSNIRPIGSLCPHWQ